MARTMAEIKAANEKTRKMNAETKMKRKERMSKTAAKKASTMLDSFGSVKKKADAAADKKKADDDRAKRKSAMDKRKAAIAARNAKEAATAPKGKKVTAAATKRGSANISKKDTPTATKAKVVPAKKVVADKTPDKADSRPTSIAAAKKAGSLYYYKDGKKMAAVLKSDLKDGESLRQYMNRMTNKTSRKSTPAKKEKKKEVKMASNSKFSGLGSLY